MPHQQSSSCKATLIASPGSHQGKTIITAGLARKYRNHGLRVAVFKIGPDYLDPTILEVASGQPVYNLDLWMMGEGHCRQLLGQAAMDNDVVLVESLMGLHDNEPSSAVLASLFDLPVTVVLNVAKFAQTASAIVHGLEQYGCQPLVHNIIGNYVGSDNHHRLMHESMGPRYAGSVRLDDRLILPERHLGLVQGSELENLDKKLDEISSLLEEFQINPALCEVEFSWDIGEDKYRPALAGKLIAIARDAAFSFVYPGNLDFLRQQGAQIVYFSPLADESVPECDALWLPGGYPELHLAQINDAHTSRESIVNFCGSGKPVIAECGGMMTLCRTISSVEGETANGFGVLNAACHMHNRFQSIGLQSVDYGQGEIRGHSFHHSSLISETEPEHYTCKQNGERGEGVYQSGKRTMSYLHHYFPSNTQAAARLFS